VRLLVKIDLRESEIMDLNELEGEECVVFFSRDLRVNLEVKFLKKVCE